MTTSENTSSIKMWQIPTEKADRRRQKKTKIEIEKISLLQIPKPKCVLLSHPKTVKLVYLDVEKILVSSE